MKSPAFAGKLGRTRKTLLEDIVNTDWKAADKNRKTKSSTDISRASTIQDRFEISNF